MSDEKKREIQLSAIEDQKGGEGDQPRSSINCQKGKRNQTTPGHEGGNLQPALIQRLAEFKPIAITPRNKRRE